MGRKYRSVRVLAAMPITQRVSPTSYSLTVLPWYVPTQKQVPHIDTNLKGS